MGINCKILLNKRKKSMNWEKKISKQKRFFANVCLAKFSATLIFLQTSYSMQCEKSGAVHAGSENGTESGSNN